MNRVSNPLIQHTPGLTYTSADAIFYAVSGEGTLIVNESSELKNHGLSPGDFAFVPAWTEHQINNDTEQDVVWLAIQSGSHPIGADLTGWSGSVITARD